MLPRCCSCCSSRRGQPRPAASHARRPPKRSCWCLRLSNGRNKSPTLQPLRQRSRRSRAAARRAASDRAPRPIQRAKPLLPGCASMVGPCSAPRPPPRRFPRHSLRPEPPARPCSAAAHSACCSIVRQAVGFIQNCGCGRRSAAVDPSNAFSLRLRSVRHPILVRASFTQRGVQRSASCEVTRRGAECGVRAAGVRAARELDGEVGGQHGGNNGSNRSEKPHSHAPVPRRQAVFLVLAFARCAPSLPCAIAPLCDRNVSCRVGPVAPPTAPAWQASGQENVHCRHIQAEHDRGAGRVAQPSLWTPPPRRRPRPRLPCQQTALPAALQRALRRCAPASLLSSPAAALVGTGEAAAPRAWRAATSAPARLTPAGAPPHVRLPACPTSSWRMDA